MGCVAQTKKEGAELFVAPDEQLKGTTRRIVSILLRPESLLQEKSLLTFLRHELFHVADMIDPPFAYEPTLPKAEGGPTYDSLITNRYRALWDVTINGRMVRRGWISDCVREQQLAEFVRAFPMLERKCARYSAGFLTASTIRILSLPLSRSIREPLLEFFMELPCLGRTALCADFQLMPLSSSRKISQTK